MKMGLSLLIAGTAQSSFAQRSVTQNKAASQALKRKDLMMYSYAVQTHPVEMNVPLHRKKGLPPLYFVPDRKHPNALPNQYLPILGPNTGKSKADVIKAMHRTNSDLTRRNKEMEKLPK